MITGIGILTVSSAGTKVRLTSGQTNADAHFGCHSVAIQVHEDNTANIYIGGKNMNVATGVDVWFCLVPPTVTNGVPLTCNIGMPSAPNAVDLKDIYIDAASNGQKVRVTALTH